MAYKVVTERHRLGTNAAIAMHNRRFKPEDFERPLVSMYFPKYTKGSLIKAVPGSPGICCFKTIAQANAFIGNNEALCCQSMIVIKVKGIKTIKNPLLVSGMGCGPDRFLLRLTDKSYLSKLPKGIITFEKVKVLE